VVIRHRSSVAPAIVFRNRSGRLAAEAIMRIARISVSPADQKGATEKNVERIVYVEGDEVLGYAGRGREEHSGEPVVKPAVKGSWRDRAQRRRHPFRPQ
jgi:hypothetical protein